MTERILHFADGQTTRVPGLTHDERRVEREYRCRNYPVGTRVHLIALAQTPDGWDDRPNLPPGLCGTVRAEPDAAGSLPVQWDNGSTLAAAADDLICTIEPTRVW